MNETYETDGGRIIRGDCLAQAENIKAGSVDLILTDPPYGTVKGLEIDVWDEETTEWDTAIPPSGLFGVSRHLLRKNGKAAFFAQDPYTSELITSDITDLPFSYRMVWKKDTFANALLAKDAPVNEYEDIAVFTKEYDSNEMHPLREYFRRVFEFIGKQKSEIIKDVGERADHCFRFDSPQFSLCTGETYDILTDEYNLKDMPDFREYNELQNIDAEYNASVPNVFNLGPTEDYKSNVLEYSKPHKGHHPTQKPLALLEDIIETFTHEGDLVVDLCAGSGSTAVAAQNTGRRFVAIEKDREYFETACDRVEGNGTGRATRGQQDLTAYAGRN